MNVTINIRPTMSTQVGFPDLTDPSDPDPEPKKTCTLETGSGFCWVGVGVALKRPEGDPC